MNRVKTALLSGKDRALSATLKIIARRHLERFGDIIDLHLDTSRRSLDIEMVLAGEDSPITVHLGGCALHRRSGKTWLTISEVMASRQWIQQAAQEFLIGRALELPRAYSRLVTLLLGE